MQALNSENIIPLFPIPIAKIPLPKSFNFDKEIETLKQLVVNPSPTEAPYNRHKSSSHYVLDLETISNLRMYIEVRITEFMRDVLALELPGQLTQSWTNCNKKGEGTHLHNHSNSIVSGVFYMQTNNSKIRFHKASTTVGRHYNMEPEVNPERASQSYYAFDWLDVPVMDGDLLLFPSYLSHSVSPNESEEDRWSLAFNSVPILHLGNHEALTELILPNITGPGYPNQSNNM